MPVHGLLGKKRGMVQVIRDDGRVVGCTVLEVGPCVVTQIKTPGRDGYRAVQIGFERVPERRVTKPERGHTGAAGPLRHLAEVAADEEDYAALAVGQTVAAAEIFHPGDHVDVTATSKGKGFAGVVKRHGFRGGPRTHGQSDRHRAPGSIGAGTSPGRVLKGTRMAGRMGGRRTTVQNLEIVQVQPERGLIFVGGSVPGAPNGLIMLRRTGRWT